MSELRDNLAKRHSKKKPFHGATTFAGKVKTVLASRKFHPGLNPKKRREYARGVVGAWAKRHE